MALCHSVAFYKVGLQHLVETEVDVYGYVVYLILYGTLFHGGCLGSYHFFVLLHYFGRVYLHACVGFHIYKVIWFVAIV